MQAKQNETPRAGYHLKDWCKAAGFCRATYYNLPSEIQPQSVRIRGRRIIIESPADYLRRMADTERQAA